MSNPPFRAGHVAIVGRPNVGKSTLLNKLVGQKISITSRKPQTTRQRIVGILTLDDAQLVFVDTPGFQTEHVSSLTWNMNRTATQALRETDVILWVVEACKLHPLDGKLEKMLPEDHPVVLVINKIDRLEDKSTLLPFIEQMAARRSFAAIVPVSAQKGTQTADLVAAVKPLLPEHPALYDADEITVSTERFLAAELVREKLFRLLGEELPYSTAVEVEKFETTPTGMRRIAVKILVDKESQKGIVVGQGGERLKEIGTRARIDMERLFGGKVFLEAWVVVRSGWADDRRTLKRLGYDAE